MGVNNYLFGMTVDLEQRCKRLLAELHSAKLHPGVKERGKEIARRLEELKQEVASLRNSTWLEHESFYPLARLEHQALYERIALIEGQAIPILLAYEERDHRFGLVVAALIEEMGFPPTLTPVVTTKSDSYYWALPELGIVGIPIGDVEGILGWPDLIHELAHLLLIAFPHLLLDFTPEVNLHFQQERNLLLDIGGSARDNQWLALAQKRWGEKEEGTWRVELAADAIATFLVGPSYGWQHVRLSASYGNDPYDPSPGQRVKDHPSDQARLDTIVAMVRHLAREKDACDITQRWNTFLRDGLYKQPPQGFQVFYPTQLLEGLSKHINSACKQLSLRPFTDHKARSNPGIVVTVDRVWRTFNSDPTKFAAFEQNAINQLYSKVQSK